MNEGISQVTGGQVSDQNVFLLYVQMKHDVSENRKPLWSNSKLFVLLNTNLPPFGQTD